MKPHDYERLKAAIEATLDHQPTDFDKINHTLYLVRSALVRLYLEEADPSILQKCYSLYQKVATYAASLSEEMPAASPPALTFKKEPLHLQWGKRHEN